MDQQAPEALQDEAEGETHAAEQMHASAGTLTTLHAQPQEPT